MLCDEVMRDNVAWLPSVIIAAVAKSPRTLKSSTLLVAIVHFLLHHLLLSFNVDSLCVTLSSCCRSGTTGAYVALVSSTSLWRRSLQGFVDYEVLHLTYSGLLFFTCCSGSHSVEETEVLQSLDITGHL